MIAIVDYGMGNLRSIQKACTAVGSTAILTSEIAELRAADKIILPGVGAFRDAIAALKSSGLDKELINQAKLGKPLLGICLGYQMLFDRSFEGGEYDGLGLIKGTVHLLPSKALKVPHMGWNTLNLTKSSYLTDGIISGDWMYFVHSYAATDCEPADILATTDYGGEIVAAVEHGNVSGFQFHPEKSGDKGLLLIKNFALNEQRKQ